ncbi:glycoside hydrolase [Flavobacterium alkalisoli]|uniref:Glycoside hydrolase n=1 Tax=Flavobacterium alkalisoli TaxID=2602769 RepID=A0A5B9FX12_9FLAO|nr:glycoside hydrolase [Flavobacterium alkalisoli]QEE50839.1 glycoside hydrolase [Flavobacterium alkalisoli]
MQFNTTNFKKNIIKAGVLLSCSLVLLSQKSFSQTKESAVRRIETDFNKTKGKLNNYFNECVGAGRANEGLRADWQQQLATAKQDCGFRYIRMHGLLVDDMAVYKEDKNGNPEYNYQYIDPLFDYLLSIDVKPFVELGFMPSPLASGDKTIFWWRGNVTPPKDYNKWEELITNLVQHFTERYGEEEVKSWYFEVWNEPNLDGFWAGTQEEYFKLYQYTAKAIKGVNKEYKVGGPATAGAAWVPEMIDFCAENNVAIDFVTTHSYGVKQGFLDEFGNSGTVLNKDEMAVSGDVINSRKQIETSAIPGLELHYTEWSSSYTPADPIHDSYHQAAYVLEKLKQVGNTANSMSYWVFTDIFEEAGPRFTPFHGGFGLMTIQGIKKPVYYAYSFLNKLGVTELVNSDAHSWVSKNEKGDIHILAWDFTNTHPGDSVNNQVYYIKDLPAKNKGKLEISIADMPKGNYKLEIYKTGYRVNDAYTAYYDMGRPSQLNRNQVKEINEKSNGAPVYTEEIKIGKNGSFSKQLDLRENDVFLICLKRK